MLLATICAVMFVIVPVSATEVGAFVPEKITPRYEIDCPFGAKHDMLANGVAYIYEGPYENPGALLVDGGFAWRCKNCGLMLGTEGSPLISGIIGRFAINDCYYTNVMAFFYNGIDGAYYGALNQDSYWKMFFFESGCKLIIGEKL